MALMDDIREAITNGELDDHREEMISLIRARNKMLISKRESRNKSELKLGYKVELHSISPKFLNGCTGTYEGPWNDGTKFAQVKMDEDPQARNRSGRTIGVPYSCLKRVGE